MSLSIVIPAHNEERRIGKTLEAYLDWFKDKKGRGNIEDFEIIVVANACIDKTVDVVKKFQRKFKEIKVLDFKPGGKGFAIREGFKEALKTGSELVGFVDADMATSPEAFHDLVENIGDYEGIFASRYIKGAIQKPRQSFMRRVASRVFNFIVRSLFLFNFRDTQCGAKLFKKKSIEKVLPRLSISDMSFDIDLLHNIKKMGFRIKEHPTVWRDVGASKVNLRKTSIQMFFSVIQLRILNSKIKRSLKLFKPIGRRLYHRLIR